MAVAGRVLGILAAEFWGSAERVLGILADQWEAPAKLVKQYDRDVNGWLNQAERQAARQSLARSGGRRGFGPGGLGGGPFGGRGGAEQPEPGPSLTPGDVTTYPHAELYDPAVLRTLFLEFEDEDWETQLEQFKGTDVDVPAKLTVDGKTYENVGIHFRGQSSYAMVPTGYKRSLNLSMDLADEDQRLYGYKTLNLLNCVGDPSMLSTVLYSHIARQHIAAPKANFVRVVINGESWGVYANAQQFDKIFLKENYGASKGTRWKASGNPGADAGLRYLGEDTSGYKSRFEMKSDDGEKEWKSLMELCRTLNETPLDTLQEELEPLLDIDPVLWFLAIDVTLVNSDGYWTRASDYNLFRDAAGKFHIVPHDMNEAFHGAGGPGGPGGRGGRGFGPGNPGGFGRPGQFGSGRPADAGRFEVEGFGPGRGGPGGFGPDGFGPGGPGGFGPGGPGGFWTWRPRWFWTWRPRWFWSGRSRWFWSGWFRPRRWRRRTGSAGRSNQPAHAAAQSLAGRARSARRYLSFVHQLAKESLDWKNLGPVVGAVPRTDSVGRCPGHAPPQSLESFGAIADDGRCGLSSGSGGTICWTTGQMSQTARRRHHASRRAVRAATVGRGPCGWRTLSRLLT